MNKRISHKASMTIPLPKPGPMEFENYPANWLGDAQLSPMSLSPYHSVRRPSNPIAIPRSHFARKPSVITPLSPGSTGTCLKCGGHQRPSTTAEIIEAGGCSPAAVDIRSYFPSPASRRSSRAHTDVYAQLHTYHWPTDQCCEGWCPDTFMHLELPTIPPTPRSSVAQSISTASSTTTRRTSAASNSSNTSSSTLDTQRRRHHQRRRSSLHQTLAQEDETRAKTRKPGSVSYSAITEESVPSPNEVRVNDRDEAERIAKNLMDEKLRHTSCAMTSTMCR